MPELYPLNVECRNPKWKANSGGFLVEVYSRARHLGPSPGPGPLVPAGPGPDWSRESRREIPPMENATLRLPPTEVYNFLIK